ncbi:hypothetical protein [Actinoplanes sp. HUAS TT8]|uniref:hypothetical protein n=1 Tax=Actinoplanes sp. HUAS TT8 TaxID=3447453 RepID=UPI003F524313
MPTLAILAATETTADRLGLVGKVVLGILFLLLVIIIGAAIGGLAVKLQGFLVAAGIVLLATSLGGWIFGAHWAQTVAGAGVGCLVFAVVGAMISGS